METCECRGLAKAAVEIFDVLTQRLVILSRGRVAEVPSSLSVQLTSARNRVLRIMDFCEKAGIYYPEPCFGNVERRLVLVARHLAPTLCTRGDVDPVFAFAMVRSNVFPK